MLFYQSEEGNEARAQFDAPYITSMVSPSVTPLVEAHGDCSCSLMRDRLAAQGREAYLEKRPPDFSRFRRLP